MHSKASDNFASADISALTCRDLKLEESLCYDFLVPSRVIANQGGSSTNQSIVIGPYWSNPWTSSYYFSAWTPEPHHTGPNGPERASRSLQRLHSVLLDGEVDCSTHSEDPISRIPQNCPRSETQAKMHRPFAHC